MWISLLLAINALAALDQAPPCREQQVSFLDSGRQVSAKELICFDASSRLLHSPDCALREGCEVLELLAKSKIPEEELYSSFGSPEFRLCHKIGGLPQIAQFEWSKKPEEVSRCIAGKSFLDTLALYRLYHAKYRLTK